MTKLRLPPGVRAIDRLMKANKNFSIERMDERALERAQTTVIPDAGLGAILAGLVIGRARAGVTIATSSFPAEHGEVPLRVYTPDASGGPRPVVVNFHGGGFALGSSRQGDWICSTVAADLDAVVVSVDYRLAPTHRFPAAVEDCYDALVWTAAHADELGGDPERIGLMGDSAGGNLAAVVAIMARDEGGPRVLHQSLIYPATDLTEGLREHESYLANTRGIVLSNADLEIFRAFYLTEDDDPSDWRLSPLHSKDLSGLPPAVVVVAGLDPLHDAGVRYAEALVAAGVHARVEDFHVMPHGFLGFPYFSRGAKPAMAAIVASQREALAR
ncbi:alpha/beta hydrolase [Nocardioides sp. cx-169]|uniref:alpha/beta hydrolase n=1 Tax=Nocardioides sp. cx-169 TaxID=2899080 RepID=UPI001E48A99E|nr:alpha/beta hydrolase [Nocardioides sp. cx-169]MCD4532845.1 alpha/beta hydrolase [Nocardioides sp. cx-169]